MHIANEEWGGGCGVVAKFIIGLICFNICLDKNIVTIEIFLSIPVSPTA
jgi:hypothetical protein